MSASREKKKRQVQPEISAAAQTTEKKISKASKRVLFAVIAVVLAAAVVFLALVSTGFFPKHSTLAVVNGSKKLTPAMVNYYYTDTYQQMQSYMGLSNETPLTEQPYGGDGFDTWADFMIDYAVHTAATNYAFYEAAVADPDFDADSEEIRAAVDSQVQMIDLYAGMYGMTGGDALLASQYGVGCSKDNFREYVLVSTVASEYSTYKTNSFTYTQEEIDAYYAENSDSFDSATFRLYSVTPAALGLEDNADAAEKCKEAAQVLAQEASGDEQAFLEGVSRFENGEDYDASVSTLRSGYKFASCAESYRQWIKDSARQEGDTTFVSDGANGYQVLYFMAHDDIRYGLPNVRHILISVSDSSDADAAAEAREQAESVLAEFEAGEKTEDAFAALAAEHSADGNAAQGGLYENISRGQMVEAFEDWCYDESRQPGDTGIVETQYGFHVMYFSGLGMDNCDYQVSSTLRSRDVSQWSAEIGEGAAYTITESAKRWLREL